MKPEQIQQLADEAGIVVTGEAVTKLCQLVAVKEREACANICDKASAVSLPAFLAMQIRARGEA